MIGCADRASLKSICVPVSGHKRPALHESSSLSVGGFSAFFLLSVSLLPDSFVCAALPIQQIQFSYFIRPFFSFSLSRRIYINTVSLQSPFCSIPAFSLHCFSFARPSSSRLVFQGVNGKHQELSNPQRSLAATT